MKTNNARPRLLLLLLLGAGLTACRVTKPYQSPNAPTTGLYRGVTPADTNTLATLPWPQIFADTLLQGLIGRGLSQNLDLKIAVARMQAAQADLRQSQAAFFPALSANAAVNRSKSSSAQLRALNIRPADATGGASPIVIPAINQYALTASASWEIDVWGKLRSARRAYAAAFRQSEAYRRTVQTQLIADIAGNYYALLAYDQQLSITLQTIEVRRRDVVTLKLLKQGAVVTGADVVQGEANQYAAEVLLPDIRQNIRQTENALSRLLAMPSDSILRTTLADQHPLTALPTGLPAQLLANRPDVQQAELAFRSAFELTNVARTYFYPALTISGTGGFATANTLTAFFTNTFYGSLIGGLVQPIFSQGINRQRLGRAQAAQAEAFYTYRAALLTAGQEVSNALYSYGMAVEKARSRRLQIAALNKSVDYTKELLKYTSATNYNDVLISEQNLLTARLNSTSDQLQQLQAGVTLYRALGGGWR